MTELMEAAAIAELSHEGHSKDTCAFCSAPTESTSEENKLTDKYDEDANELPGLEREGIAHENSSGELGKSLASHGPEQIFARVTISGIQGKLPVQSAAHHLIPGNASLRDSPIMKYLHTEGMDKGNIGYNVNNQENGVWLVGNYALRGKEGLPKWGSKGAGFRHKYQQDPYEYAKAAMMECKRQFHDAHGEYNELVKEVLRLLAEKMRDTMDVWCKENKDRPKNPKDQQLLMLVNRLNTISRRMKKMLEHPGPNWKKNVWTSQFSSRYIEEELS
jgi:hypothetical protein